MLDWKKDEFFKRPFPLEAADYHTHSRCSDGKNAPAQVVALAQKSGIKTLALTDHDGVEGVAEAVAEGKRRGLFVVPGVEMSTRTTADRADGFSSIGLHILGYGIDVEDSNLLHFLEEIREKRVSRNLRLLRALQEMGNEITMEEVLAYPGQTYVGKPHMARVLIEKGYARDIDDCFATILQQPEIKAIKKERLDPVQAIRQILSAGGIPVLAHPGQIKTGGAPESKEHFQKVDVLLEELCAAGLLGLECYYRDHTKKETATYLEMAKRKNLYVTRGSDYHGDPGHRFWPLGKERMK